MIKDQYSRDLVIHARRIRDFSPEDLSRRFVRYSGCDEASFSTCSREIPGSLTAVDGSNATVLESGSFSIVAARASGTTFGPQGCLNRNTTPIRLLTVGPDLLHHDFSELYESCFGVLPISLPDYNDPVRAASVIRDTLEYFVVLEHARRLLAGAVLVMDGAIRVEHASHHPVLMDILKLCGRREIRLAAVTKRSSLTWGNGFPLVRAVAAMADDFSVSAPWYIRVPEEVLDQHRYQEWQHGDIYVARLHPRSPRAFKVEVPQYANKSEVDRTISTLAAFADDGRITGYPYPLLDVHQLTKIDADSVDMMQQDIMGEISRLGMDMRDYQDIFGDQHDEFDRY